MSFICKQFSNQKNTNSIEYYSMFNIFFFLVGQYVIRIRWLNWFLWGILSDFQTNNQTLQFMFSVSCSLSTAFFSIFSNRKIQNIIEALNFRFKYKNKNLFQTKVSSQQWMQYHMPINCWQSVCMKPRTKKIRFTSTPPSPTTMASYRPKRIIWILLCVQTQRKR